MAGDILVINVNAYYNATSGNNYNISALGGADLLANLLSTATGVPSTGSAHATLIDLQSKSSVLSSAGQGFLNNRSAPNAGVIGGPAAVSKDTRRADPKIVRILAILGSANFCGK